MGGLGGGHLLCVIIGSLINFSSLACETHVEDFCDTSTLALQYICLVFLLIVKICFSGLDSRNSLALFLFVGEIS